MQLRTALCIGHVATLDRELLLASVLKCDRSFILAHPEHVLSDAQRKRFEKRVKRREAHEPLAYILGAKEFFGLSFLVNRFTLIPRPETEILVEQVLQTMEDRRSKMEKEKRDPGNFYQSSNVNHPIAVVDIGTGSGCIIISIAKYHQSSIINHQSSIVFFATDISKRSLQVAQKNAARHGVAPSITFIQSDLLKNIQRPLETFDEIIVLANLPYLSENLYQNTESTVQNYEPKAALLSGRDGLDHYQKLLSQLRGLAQTKKVSFLLEISPEQDIFIQKLCHTVGAKLKAILPDLAGKKRIVQGYF